jgi:hypothetical protein
VPLPVRAITTNNDPVKAILLSLLILVPTLSFAGELPNPGRTPGAINEAMSERDYHRLCHEKGWTKLYRPPTGFTNSLKRLQMKQYGYGDLNSRDYEEDYLISLCLAGALQDPHNLWPQPRTGEWNAAKKDKLEAAVCRAVCSGKADLNEAQRDIARDWIAAYGKDVAGHVGN